jgi:V/A-type H+-transporting ATPase subunit K
MTTMFGLIMSVTAVLGTIALGGLMQRAGFKGSRKMFICVTALSCLFVLSGAVFVLLSAPALAADAAEGASVPPEAASSNGMGFIGMALATGLACVGAGIAVGSVGSAALGLVGEQPGAIGTTLIYVGLAEGVAIYGIVISMLIFSKLA